MDDNTNDIDVYFKKFTATREKTYFELLYKALFKNLFKISYAITKREVESEDIVSEIFLKLWKNNSLDSIKNITAYLNTAVRNKSYDWLKSAQYKKESSSLGKEFKLFNKSQNEDQPLDILILKEMVERLDKAMLEMKGVKKEVFELIRYEGFTYQKAADAKGISIKTVEKYMKENLAILDKYKLPNSRKKRRPGNKKDSINLIAVTVFYEVINFFNFFSKKRRVNFR